MTDEELTAIKEFAGDLLVRAFRGEVDLASAMVEVRDLTPAALFEEAELPDDLDDDDDDPEVQRQLDELENPPPHPLDDGTIADTEAEMDAALEAALAI